MMNTTIERLSERELDMMGSVDIFGKENPASLENLAPTMIVEQIFKMDPALFNLDEDEIERKVNPSPTLHRLRVSFWHAYHKAATTGKRLTLSDVHSGICHFQFFTSSVLKRHDRLAFILKPPVAYALAMEEALMHAVKRMREILSLPIVNEETGKVDTKLAALMIKSMELLDQRLHGMATQKIESKSLNMHVSKNVESLPSPIDLDKRIRELQESLLPHLPRIPELIKGSDNG